jgi:hypothetical protein
MRFIKTNIVILCIMGVFFSSAWAAETGWKKIGESKGIIGYTRSTPKSSIDQMKGVGIVDAPVAVVEALIRDFPAQTEYMYKCKESMIVNTPEFKNSGDTMYDYNVTAMPYPVKNRDAVAKATFTVDKASGTVYVHVEAIKTAYGLDPKKVRMPLVIVDYTLAPKGPDKTEVTYEALADPGGNLPAFVVNMLTKNLSIETIGSIREMVKKDKYKNAKTIVTVTPHKG